MATGLLYYSMKMRQHSVEMTTKEINGRTAKYEGHIFEHKVADAYGGYVDGGSRTKVDIRSKPYNISVKNPSGKNTQIWLVTQERFIDALDIDDYLSSFVHQFFGGDRYSHCDRHRKTWSSIDKDLREAFLNCLNARSDELFKLIFTHGYQMNGSVDVLAWATEKNNVDSVIFLDLDKVKEDFRRGIWTANPTTLEFRIDGEKLLHVQMKGSGPRYSNHYHAVQFHVHGNFKREWYCQMDQNLLYYSHV